MLSNGDKIGPYTVRDIAGQGGMATVYQAWHDGLHRFEALKVPRGAGGDPDSAFIQRLLAEARVAAGLQHPHIVAIHSVSEPLAPIPFFAMTWVEGRDLAKILAEKRTFSLQETISILEPVADALDYAHSKGVVHRDIKPANILIEDINGALVPRVVDFGISRAAEDEDGATKLTKSGMIVGTPEYMSPEQAGSGEVVDHRTDLYSLAVVAYEMLCGGPPFTAGSGVSRLSILISHVRDTAPLFQKCPDFPVEAGQVLLSALAKSPLDRPRNCREFLAQLKAGASSDFSLSSASLSHNTERTPFDASGFDAADAATLCERPVQPVVPVTMSPRRAGATALETRSDSIYSLRARLEAAQSPVSGIVSGPNPLSVAPSVVISPAIVSSETQSEAQRAELDALPPTSSAEVLKMAPLAAQRAEVPTIGKKETGRSPHSRIPMLAAGAGLVVGAALVFVLLGRNSPSATTAEAKALVRAPLQVSVPDKSVAPLVPQGAPLTPPKARPVLRTVRLKRTRDVAFSTQTRRSSALALGVKSVEQRGQLGKREIVMAVSYRGESEVARRIESERLTRPPVPQIVVIGNRQPRREVQIVRQASVPQNRERRVEESPVASRPRVRRARQVVSRPVVSRPATPRTASRIVRRPEKPTFRRVARSTRSVTTRAKSQFRRPRFVREAPLPP